MNDFVLLGIEDGVATVTLNLPEKRNAMLEEAADAFARTIQSVGANPAVRCLILTGAGRVFSAGGDLAMLQGLTEVPPEESWRHMRAFYPLYLCITQLTIPTVAALNGHAVGAGLSLALACDIRIAAEGAKLGANFLQLGLHPGMGITHTLPRLVGTAKACELLLTGELITAHEAERIGLVNRVCPADQVLAQARAMARTIASLPGGAVEMAKAAIYRTGSLQEAVQYEALAQGINYHTADLQVRLRQAQDQIASQK